MYDDSNLNQIAIDEELWNILVFRRHDQMQFDVLVDSDSVESQ